MDARLDYAAGALRLAAGPARRALPDGRAVRRRPLRAGERLRRGPRRRRARAAARRARAGLRVVSQGQLRQTASVTFSPKSDLALAVALGAVDGDLELGGLRLTDLVARGRREPRDGALLPAQRRALPRRRRSSAGAAELTVLGLGNSRCDRIAFEGGVGRVTLDFGGAWTSSSAVSSEDGARRGGAPAAAAGRRPHHARQVSRDASSRRAWSGGARAISRPATTRPRATWTST